MSAIRWHHHFKHVTAWYISLAFKPWGLLCWVGHWFQLYEHHCNGGDTQSRNLYKKLVQVGLYKKLDCLTWFLVQNFSCTSFLHRIQHGSIPHKKLACTWLEWWALIGWLPIAAMFSFCCVDVVDSLLYKVNIVCLLIYF